MSILLLELPTDLPRSESAGSAAAPEYRYALTRDGQTLSASGQASASLLPHAEQLVLVVPPSVLSWHALDLPKLPAGRFLAGVQALLEESLLQEPQELHLALQPGVKPAQAGSCQVCVCDKNWLQSHVQLIEKALSRPIQRIAPLMAPGAASGGAVVYQPENQTQAWWSQSQPAGVNTLPWSSWGSFALDMPSEVWVEPAWAQAVEQQLDARSEAQAPKPRLHVQPMAQTLLLALAHSWDLAQFDLARSASQMRTQRLVEAWQAFAWSPQWKWPRRAVLAMVIVQILGLNLWAWMERSTLSRQRTQMNQLLTQTFPGVSVVIDAPVQMQRELQRLEQGRGQEQAGDLEPLLQWYAQNADAAKPPAGIDYVQGQLNLRDVALAPVQLERLQQQAQARGLALRQQGTDLIVGAKQP